MNELSKNFNQRMSSLEISDVTGKRHYNIIRDIRKQLTDLSIDALKFEGIYIDAANRTKSMFYLDHEQTMVLATGYNVKLRHAIVKRWMELETKQEPVQIQTPVINSAFLLQISQQMAEVEHQRDEAIRTKSQISDKKTATAMATASAAVRESKKTKKVLVKTQEELIEAQQKLEDTTKLYMIPTELGELCGLSAAKINKLMNDHSLQFKDSKGKWHPTGKAIDLKLFIASANSYAKPDGTIMETQQLKWWSDKVLDIMNIRRN